MFDAGYISIVVKGNETAAREACKGHGVPVLSSAPVNMHETRLVVPLASELALASWFTEPIAVVRGEGFPVGSLLWYREMHP